MTYVVVQDGATGHREYDLHSDVVEGRVWAVVLLAPDEKLRLKLLVINRGVRAQAVGLLRTDVIADKLEAGFETHLDTGRRLVDGFGLHELGWMQPPEEDACVDAVLGASPDLEVVAGELDGNLGKRAVVHLYDIDHDEL